MAGKVVYPIGVKLNVIITLLLIFSLGSVILLVAVFVYADVEKTAIANNRDINNRTAAMAALELNSIRSGVVNFLNIVESAAANGADIESRTALAGFFFTEQREIALIIIPDADGGMDGAASYSNSTFMEQNEISASVLSQFIMENPVAVSRARTGAAVLLNAAPVCNGVPMLALIFPRQAAGAGLSGGVNLSTGVNLYQAAAVFFSSQNFTETFGAGANSSFLTNDAGEVLAHPDQELAAAGANLMDDDFVRECWNSGRKTAEAHVKNAQGIDSFVNFERIEGFNNAGVFTAIQSAVVFEGIRAATRRNAALSLMVAFISVLFVWFFSKTFSRPLVELTGAVRQIDEGNYHIELENSNADETGALTQSVLSMSRALGNFERFTNKMIARLSREGTLNSEGTDKTATLFFSDIRSFTAMSEKLTAREVVRLLNAYMERMVFCVERTGGAIDKFIGDAIMAHWGAVESAGSPALDALNGARCALLMRACLFNFNAGRAGTDAEPKIKIGCGLNTGTVLAGQIGSDARVVYTVIGEAVTFADRTETFNKPFGTEILISEHTWEYVHHLFITEEMPTVEETGKKVRIFALVNVKDKDEEEYLLRLLDDMPENDKDRTRRCIGAEGPQTLAELRKLLNIPEPDLSNLNLEEEEKKYSLVTT
ncbi:MAG: HAMP domain-containing protein [Spirochaetaceae bacterium]|jgi:adenylate cyclase|nr:HAMP domain-containing protein [Spirochaetaceae bacterium]